MMPNECFVWKLETLLSRTYFSEFLVFFSFLFDFSSNDLCCSVLHTEFSKINSQKQTVYIFFLIRWFNHIQYSYEEREEAGKNSWQCEFKFCFVLIWFFYPFLIVSNMKSSECQWNQITIGNSAVEFEKCVEFEFMRQRRSDGFEWAPRYHVSFEFWCQQLNRNVQCASISNC